MNPFSVTMPEGEATNGLSVKVLTFWDVDMVVRVLSVYSLLKIQIVFFCVYSAKNIDDDRLSLLTEASLNDACLGLVRDNTESL